MSQLKVRFGFCVAILILCGPLAQADDAAFPFAVNAAEGPGVFRSGDQIAITSVRGTSAQFTAGNTYEIHGKYRLLSNPQATLSADVVAPNGNAPTLTAQQSINLNQGSGDFTLVLPYAFDGRPRIRLTTPDAGSDAIGSVQLIAGKFPYSVDFKGDAPQFNPGDNLAISEIRCSTPTIRPGSVLQITGMFNLASADNARLAPVLSDFPPQSPQTPDQFVNIEQGRGSFALVLPVSTLGKLHLLIWPSGGGEAIGSLTLRLGRSKLGSPAHPTPAAAIESPSSNVINLNMGTNVNVDSNGWVQVPSGPPLPNFNFNVPFQLGWSYFPPGDSIKIAQVLGTKPTIKIGGMYLIRGTYTLKSASQALLATWVTVDNYSKSWAPSAIPQQCYTVNAGTANYILVLPVNQPGWPHVAFYPAPGGGVVSGTQYFGTGDTVMQSPDPSHLPEDICVNNTISITQTMSGSPQSSPKR